MNLFHFKMFFQLCLQIQISTNLNFPPHSERIFLHHGAWFLLNSLLQLLWIVDKNLLIFSLFLYGFQIQSQFHRRFSMVCVSFESSMLFLVGLFELLSYFSHHRAHFSYHRAQYYHHRTHFFHHRAHFLHVHQSVKILLIHQYCSNL